MDRPRRRVPWILFWGVSLVALSGACVGSALATGSRSSTALTFLGGLVVVGIAAAVMTSVVSPRHRRDDATHVPWGSTGWFER